MKVWVDLTNSPHVLVLAPVIRRLRQQGHEVQVTARDFAQTLAALRAARDRLLRDRPPPRRRADRQGPRSRGSLLAAGAVRAHARLRPRDRPRLQRHHRRGAAAADPLLDDVRLRVGDRPAQRQLPSRAGGGRARRDPRRAACALRRGATSCAATRDSRRSTTSTTSSPTRRCWPSSGLDAAQPIAVVRTPPAVSLYHRFENDLFGQVLQRLRAPQTVVLPRTEEQREELGARRRLPDPGARDRRAVADRLRRPRGVRRRHDEPRGGGARHAGLHRLRGPARRRRRAPDRRGPPAQARAGRRGCAGRSARTVSGDCSGSGATRGCSWSC